MVKVIDSLQRGLQVYRRLEQAGPLGLSELARETALSKATLLRILTTLAEAGFAHQRLNDRKWLVAGGAEVSGPHGRLAAVAGPVLDELCQRVLWPSDVGIYDRGSIRILETSRRLSPFLVNRDILMRNIHVLPSAMGRAILAWSTPARRKHILSELAASEETHDRPARTPSMVTEIVEATIARGYAKRSTGYFISEPREAKVTAVAVPVIVGGEAIAAINLSWVAGAITEAEFEKVLLEHLRAAALRISEDIEGFTAFS